MGIESTIYRIILLGHIVSAIVGFGGLIAHGAYHAQAVRSAPRDAGVLMGVTTKIAHVSHYALYAVLAFGIVLVSLSDDVYEFSELWVSASFVVWFLIVGLTHGLVRPAQNQLLGLSQGASTATLDESEETSSIVGRLAFGEAATQLLLATALVLMIWKPGG